MTKKLLSRIAMTLEEWGITLEYFSNVETGEIDWEAVLLEVKTEAGESNAESLQELLKANP
jgi:hypothetical protein